MTFQIHGGGHAFAIYEVSKDTTRDELGQFLCVGDDPEHIADPTLHRRATSAPRTPTREHVIRDGHNDVVIVAQWRSEPPPAQPPHPDNRVWSNPVG